MTRLRTVWGIDLIFLKKTFSHNLITKNKKYIDQLINTGHIINKNNRITLTNKGKLLGDEISSNLFV